MVSQGGTGSGVSGPSVAELYKTLFGINGQNGRPRHGLAPRRAPDHGAAAWCARTAPWCTPEDARPAADRVPDLRRRPSCGPTGATREAADVASATAPRPTPCRRRGAAARLLHRDSALRRIDWTLLLAVLGAVRASAARWCGRRPGRPLSTPAATRTAFLKKHILNVAIGLVLGVVASVFDYRMLRAYAPVLYVLSIAGLVAVLSPLGSTINGSHSWIVLPAGFSIQPSELAKVALVVGMAMLLSEKRDAEDTPRDVDVVLGAGVRRRTAGAWSCCSPTSAPRWSIAAIVLGVVAVSGAPLRWVVGLVVGAVLVAFVAVQTGRAQGLPAGPVPGVLRPDRRPQGRRLQRAAGPDRDRLRAASTARACSTARRPRASSSRRSRPTSSSPSRGRSSASSAPALVVLLLGLVLWRAGRIAHERRGPVRPAGGHRRSSAGSRSRPSRTSA